MELSAFVGGEGFRVIPIGAAHPYACNVLNLGAGRILSAHAESARQIVRSPHFQVRWLLARAGAARLAAPDLLVVASSRRPALDWPGGHWRDPVGAQGDVRVLDFSAITSLYGSLHCASQVVRRTTAGARPPPL